jgi:hypothetical protein
MPRHAVPAELRAAIDDVGGRFIAELPVHAHLFERVVQRIGFPQAVGIAELPDEIRRMLKSADVRKWT